jgi:hypothetical protein
VVGNSFRFYLPTIPVVPLCLFFCCGGKLFWVAQIIFFVVARNSFSVTYLSTIPVVPLCQFFGCGGKLFLVAQFLRKILIRFL